MFTATWVNFQFTNLSHKSFLDQCNNFHSSEITLKIRAIEFWCFRCHLDRQLVHIIFVDKKINIYIIKQICNADVHFLSSGISKQYPVVIINKNWKFSNIPLWNVALNTKKSIFDFHGISKKIITLYFPIYSFH